MDPCCCDYDDNVIIDGKLYDGANRTMHMFPPISNYYDAEKNPAGPAYGGSTPSDEYGLPVCMFNFCVDLEDEECEDDASYLDRHGRSCDDWANGITAGYKYYYIPATATEYYQAFYMETDPVHDPDARCTPEFEEYMLNEAFDG